jgi:hypothetical protein
MLGDCYLLGMDVAEGILIGQRGITKKKSRGTNTTNDFLNLRPKERIDIKCRT